jgi:hypothetical protein
MKGKPWLHGGMESSKFGSSLGDFCISALILPPDTSRSFFMVR